MVRPESLGPAEPQELAVVCSPSTRGAEGGCGSAFCNSALPLQALSWHLAHEQTPLSLDLQAGLDCCCLALQLPGLRSALSSPEMMTRACSLIHCIRFILEASESMTSVLCHTNQ